MIRVMPYFYQWLRSDCRDYPDGRGRYYQTSVLIDAFDVLLTVHNREEENKTGK